MKRAENYVYRVYRTKSFSKAAKELYISQPSLSATVKKLESELGFDIFDRSKNPVALTPKGAIYIEYIEECIQSRKNMQHRIEGLTDFAGEILAVGGRNYFARIMLPVVCGKFHSRFPDVEIKIDFGESGASNDLFDRLDSGKVECVISFSYDETRHSCIPIYDDRYVIAVHRDTPGAEKLIPYALTREEILSGKDFPDKKADYSLFENLEFIRYTKSATIRREMADFMERCRISKCYAQNSRKYDVKYDMMLEGMGSVITTELLVRNRPDRSDEVLYFIPNAAVSSRVVKIVYKKSTSLSRSAEEFISIAKEMCDSMKQS